jgi:PAS domain S-box-containing protein
MNEKDLTLRELTEKLTLRDEQLIESEARYKTLFNDSPFIKLIINPDTCLIEDSNTSACEFYGWSCDELRGKSLFDINVMPTELVKKEMLLALTEKRNRFFFQHKIANGEIKEVEVHSAPIILQGKTLLYSIVTDVSEKRKLEKLKNLNRQSINNVTETIVTVDKDGKFVDVNKAFCEHSGYTLNELLNMHVYDIDKNQSKEGWPLFFEKLKEKKKMVFETLHYKKNGESFPVELTITYFEYDGNDYHCGFARDITERLRIEADYRSRDKLFHSLFELCPFPIIITSIKSGEILDINSASVEISGYTKDELIGKPVIILYNDPTDRDEVLKLIKKGYGKTKNVSITFKKKSGEKIDCILSIQQLSSEELSAIITIAQIHDIQLHRRKTDTEE